MVAADTPRMFATGSGGDLWVQPSASRESIAQGFAVRYLSANYCKHLRNSVL